MQNGLLFLYTETPLHAGVGSSVSVVDLPIQRERTTQYPMVQGTGVKGALRSHCALHAPEAEVDAVFGPGDARESSKYAGAVAVGDARIVLFPVRALRGVFAYVTSAHALARLGRDLEAAGVQMSAPPASDTGALVSDASVLVDGQVVLEEFSFKGAVSDEVKKWAAWLSSNALPNDTAYAYWQTHVKNALVLLPEDDFRDFVVNSTQIDTHVRLDRDKKTVENGALWTTESLPPDALLVSSIVIRPTRGGAAMDEQGIFTWLQGATSKTLQLGGDETTGQGVVAVRWA